MAILGFKLPPRVASRPRGTKGRSGRTGRGPGRSSGKKGGKRTGGRNNYGPRPPQPFKPPLPDPLPPAPLLSPRGVLGVGLVVAGYVALRALQRFTSQIWGRYNNPQRVPPNQVSSAEFIGYGTYRGTVINHQAVGDRMNCPGGGLYERGWINETAGGMGAVNVYGFKYQLTAGVHSTICNPTGSAVAPSVPFYKAWKQETRDGPWVPAGEWLTSIGVTDGKWGWSNTTTNSPYVKGLTFNDRWLPIPSFGPGTGRGIPAPQPLKAPPLPLLTGRPDPSAPPGPIREAEPVTQPQAPSSPDAPGPAPLPKAPVIPPPVRPPLTANAPDATDNGKLVRPKPAPVPVTDPDSVFPIPDGPGVTGNGPQPNLPEIAKELGRIERKLEALLNPQSPEVNPVPNWLEDLGKAIEVLQGLMGGGSYWLTEPCDPDGDGKYVRREVKYSGAIGMLGLLSNKVDALAVLMQAAKDLRQPVCPPPASTGEGVTIHFASLLTPPGDKHKLQKLFRYNDQSSSPLEVHHGHWKDFTWQSGPVMVISDGLKWGRPRVWAVSLEEGKRVLGHAAAVAGVDLGDPRHRWVYRTVADPRYGRRETMEVKRLNYGLRAITKRPGPDGPLWVIAE